MIEFRLAFGRTIAVDNLEYDFQNHCMVNGQAALFFDILRPTPYGRIYQGSLFVHCKNFEWIEADQLRKLIRESRAKVAMRDLHGRAEASL